MATHDVYCESELVVVGEAAQVEVTNVNLAPFVMRQFPWGEYLSRTDGWLPRVARGIARFLSRPLRRRRRFEAQIDPRTADELLPDWEQAYELVPEADDTIEDRRLAVLTKVRSTGGVTDSYYEGLAASFGYGDAVVTDAADPFTTVSECDDALAGGEWKLTFLVTAASQGTDRDEKLQELIRSQMLAGWYVLFEFT